MTKGRTYLGLGLALGLFGAAAAPASAQMRITEWMYNDTPEEFVEFTNIGSTPIDMTGWSFDDVDNVPGATSLAAFGTVQPSESVILAENTAADFRTRWGLLPSVKVIGGNSNNLGRGDEINLFDGATLVDRLTYGDVVFPGTIRTLARSGGPTSDAVLGTNNVANWAFVDTGDPHGIGFTTSTTGQTGNPGAYVPEPASLSLIGLAGMTLARRRRR